MTYSNNIHYLKRGEILRKFKNHLVLDTVRDIKKSWEGYILLIFLLIMGICSYLGFYSGDKLMLQWLHDFYGQQNMMDISIQSVISFTSEDVSALEEVVYSGNVEGSFSSVGEVDDLVTLLLSYEEENQVNRPLRIEGRFLSSSDEIMVHPSFLAQTSYKIGDTIVIDSEESQEKEYCIVGTAVSPLYISEDYGNTKLGFGHINSMIFVHASQFVGDFTDIYLKTSESFHISPLLEVGKVLYEKSLPPYLTEIEEHIKTLEQELEAEIIRQQLEKESLSAEINQQAEEISQSWRDYEDNKELRTESQSLEVEKEIRLLEAKYWEALTSQQQIAEDGAKEIASLEKELGQRERDLEVLRTGGWEYFSREDNLSYQRYATDGEQVSRLGRGFPVIMFVVTSSVAWAIVSQKVGEQGKNIATLSALGYTTGEIIYKYLFYVYSALGFALLGGLMLGLHIIPKFLYSKWKSTYILGEFSYGIFWNDIVTVGLLTFFLLTFCVILSCVTVLKRKPAELFRPKTDGNGKKIWLERIDILWHDLTFDEKVSLRNVFRHKRRSWLTILSISVVSGVLVSAFGLVDATTKAMFRQYEVLYRHTTEIFVEKNRTYEEYLEIKGILSAYQLNHSYTEFATQPVNVSFGGTQETSTLFTVEDGESLDKVLYLRQNAWKPYDMPETGAIVPLKLAELLGVSLGDFITIEGEFGQAEAMVTALSEFYTEQNILMSHSYYERITEEEVRLNRFWVNYDDLLTTNLFEVEELDLELLALAGVSAINHRNQEDTYLQNGIGTSALVLNLILCSAVVLVFMVVAYLNYHNIRGRRVELASLKVFGLSDYEISAYFYRENILLTFYGLLLGMVVGQNFHHWFVRSLELPHMMLFRGVAVQRFIYGAGLTVIIAVIVNIMMYYLLQKVDICKELQGIRE